MARQRLFRPQLTATSSSSLSTRSIVGDPLQTSDVTGKVIRYPDLLDNPKEGESHCRTSNPSLPGWSASP
jgi:hypothetical protein